MLARVPYYASFVSHAAPYLASVESGTWEDADGSKCADDGEAVLYIGVVKNEGTVTLGALVLVDARSGMTCEETESGLLGQGETIECRGSTEVRF